MDEPEVKQADMLGPITHIALDEALIEEDVISALERFSFFSFLVLLLDNVFVVGRGEDDEEETEDEEDIPDDV